MSTDTVDKEVQTTNLKNMFKKYFPVQAKALEGARSDEDLIKLRKVFVKEAWARVAELSKQSDFVKTNTGALKSSGPQGIEGIAFIPPKSIQFMEATGNDVETSVTSAMNALSSVANLPSNASATVIALEMWGGMSGAIGLKMAAILRKELGVEIDEEVSAWSVEFLAYAIEYIGTVFVCTLAAAIVLVVVLPILYIAEKPANCVLTVMNDTDHFVNLKNENIHSEHGDVVGITQDITSRIPFNDQINMTYVGFFNSIKTTHLTMGFEGTTTGYEFDLINVENETMGSFAVAVSCPLTEDNELSCGFNKSASEIVKSLTHKDLSMTDDMDGFSLKVSLNSTSGSTAYYIATIKQS